jgi:hypothetical protein
MWSGLWAGHDALWEEPKRRDRTGASAEAR